MSLWFMTGGRMTEWADIDWDGMVTKWTWTVTDQDTDDGIEPLEPDTEDDDTDESELPPPIDPLPVPGAEGLPDDVKNGDAEIPSEEP